MNNIRFFVYPAVAVFSLFAALAAHSDDITSNTTTQVWANTKTRAPVGSELTAAPRWVHEGSNKHSLVQ